MSVSMEQIEREALELPPEQRARLVDKLWESLGETTEPVLSQEWQTEIERRRREILEGKVKAVPGDEVSRQAWARVNSGKP
jgi:putative addiction module component (TIGR02574 family)